MQSLRYFAWDHDWAEHREEIANPWPNEAAVL